MGSWSFSLLYAQKKIPPKPFSFSQLTLKNVSNYLQRRRRKGAHLDHAIFDFGGEGPSCGELLPAVDVGRCHEPGEHRHEHQERDDAEEHAHGNVGLRLAVLFAEALLQGERGDPGEEDTPNDEEQNREEAEHLRVCFFLQPTIIFVWCVFSWQLSWAGIL